MWFLILKLFKIGFKEAKKHKANKRANPEDPNFTMQQQPEVSTFAPPQSKSSKAKFLLQMALRVLQFALGVAVIGLYGGTLNTAREDNSAPPSQWVYAVVVGFLGASTALVYLVLGMVMKSRPLGARQGTHLPLFLWESVLCVLLLVLFGLFGKMYIGVYGEKDGVDVKKMRRAVWVDLVMLVVWVGTAFWAGLRWWKGAKGADDGESQAGKGDLEMGEK
ncbi:hypothetical protein FE257_004740 [Aspergillus nanangensis]|uniref:MARVEL domain-containing protein n=1 Tax=Aspergillus nanangensis TaxID=2582783 RepID=A0AAD4GVV0_ASPNN|nr:hypothetical protein FE257_004740 [Aspergillus nanangensis]